MPERSVEVVTSDLEEAERKAAEAHRAVERLAAEICVLVATGAGRVRASGVMQGISLVPAQHW